MKLITSCWAQHWQPSPAQKSPDTIGVVLVWTFVRRILLIFLFVHVYFIPKIKSTPKKSLSLFKACWRISMSQRMRAKSANSPEKANRLRWTSRKPSRRWWFWGGWHCHCCWRRTAGNCTWGPGCTGHCWAGCGWTFFLNERGGGRHDETHRKNKNKKRDVERRCHFSVSQQHEVCSRCRPVSDERLRDLTPHAWLSVDLELRAEQKYREMWKMKSSLLLPAPPPTPQRYFGFAAWNDEKPWVDLWQSIRFIKTTPLYYGIKVITSKDKCPLK